MNSVYLVWINDSLAGVYKHESKAFLRVVDIIISNANHQWKQISGRRWYQVDGSIARLEIKEEEVIS